MVSRPNSRETTDEQIWVLCDFDGTVSVRDVQVALLNAFGAPDWREKEKEILVRGAKSASYLPVIYSDWRATAEEMRCFVDENADIDQAFPGFVELCRQRGHHLEIVSDGLDLYIDRLLHRYGLQDIPFTSNQFVQENGRVNIKFPNRSQECGNCGNCKRERIRRARRKGALCVVYIGDGISDECPARHADVLFAKDRLAAYCDREGIAYFPFSGFDDVIRKWDEAIRECPDGAEVASS